MTGRQMRRRDKEIDDPAELGRILDEAMVLHVAMVDGGLPYMVPLNFARENDVLWLHSAGKGRKLDCLRASPQVCVEAERFIDLVKGTNACDDWTARYESVIGFGVAEVIEDPEDKLQGLSALMRKYSGRDDWQFDAKAVKSVTTVIRVRLGSLTGKRSPV